MKFEGTQVNIPIKGIMRAGTDNLCADGAMNEVIGMEYKDGSWLPYKESEEEWMVRYYTPRGWAPLPNITRVYLHKTSDGSEHYLFLQGNNNVLYSEVVRHEEERLIDVGVPITGEVKDVSFVGNVVSVATETNLENYIWDASTTKYKVYSSKSLVELLPRILFAVSNQDSEKTSEGSVNSGQVLYARSIASPITFYNTIQSIGPSVLSGTGLCEKAAEAARKAQFAVQENGRLYGSILACYAYRLKNGDLIMASSPVLLNFPNIYSQVGDVSHKVYMPKSAVTGSEGTLRFRRSVNSDSEWVSADMFMYDEDYMSTDGMFAVDVMSDTGTYLNTYTEMPPLFAYYHDIHSYDSNNAGFVVAGCLSNYLNYKIESDIPDDLRNLIQSVCVFISEQVNPYKDLSGDKTECLGYLRLSPEADYSAGYRFQLKSREDMYKEILKLKNMYLVEEIPFSSIKESNGWKVADLKNKLGDHLLVQESLPLSAFNMRENVSGKLTAYNYRLHMYQYTQRLFKGYDPYMMKYFPFSGQLHYGIEYDDVEETVYYKVNIDSLEGHSEVWGQVDMHPNVINPMIAYPDPDATSIEFFTYNGTEWRMKHYDLAPSASGHFAFYLSDDLDINVPWGGAREVVSEPSMREINYLKTYYNGLKVSDVAYPAYFPPSYTYRLGNEKIIGLARLTMPMSQDNFGNYSLIIFCTDGIYSLRVDASGNGAYTSQAFVSPEVCVNPNSICEIGGAVFFAGDKGLMILTGENNVELYAPHLNGYPRFLPASIASKEAHGVYRKMIDSTQILSKDGDSFGDSISQEDFRDFIADEETHLVYISNKNKLLAFNGKKKNGERRYDFSYLIDIQTRNATKLPMTAICDNGNIIGREIWENGDNGYTIHTFGYLSKQDSEIPSLIQSRPIKVQQDDKCSYRVVLTGYFEGIQDNWADLVVMGSLDADHWRVIGVKEKKLVGGFHNLGCLTERGSWKYLMFIFAGKLTNESHIDSIDITVDGRYNNKKR